MTDPVAPSSMTAYSELKQRLAKSPFRSRFRLKTEDCAYIAEKGWKVLEGQARKIISERLAPALPEHDGKQTPMRGHVVFLAQHATGCCCRGCLEKWHGIARGRELSNAEVNSIVGIILSWLADQAGDLSRFPQTPDLF